MEQVKTEEQYNAILISLAYECPLYIDNVNCPLKDVRLKNLYEKMKWLCNLSIATKKTIYQYHTNCFSEHQAQDKIVCRQNQQTLSINTAK
ncbi:MAG: hypothetical protein WGN25_00470 [Candidatus Electrothrix sp. GW3-4]|uniref:hypothetical protein n=1 Tax=Candidatus Electrothrix sp. GW3-4 TaxID=3126740 RepID=UPI0030D1A654